MLIRSKIIPVMSYDPKSSEEYKLLRAEILQYIQNYHNVRTFMFTATTAIFAFLLKSEPQEPFLLCFCSLYSLYYQVTSVPLIIG